MKTYYSIRKITSDQGDDYKTGYLLDYNYLIKYYKMIAIDWNKQQALDSDPKAIQQINSTGNLRGADNREFKYFYKELWKYCEFILL